MDLRTFKAYVDSLVSSSPSNAVQPSADQLLASIRACFTVQEYAGARSDVFDIIVDLGLRYLCEQDPPNPYLGVAEAIREALKNAGSCSEPASDWQSAVRFAIAHARKYPIALPLDQRWISDARVSSLSKAIRMLRNIGYTIGLPASGGLDVSEGEKTRLADNIGRLAASLGGGLAESALLAIAPSYSPITHRFNLGRTGAAVRINASPDRPLAYLYQLGLRYSAQPAAAADPQVVLTQLIDLVTCAVALLDLSQDIFSLIGARPTDIPRIVQSSLVYDAVFLVTQADPKHAREYLQWMMSQPLLQQLKDAKGRTSEKVLSVARMMLATCEKAPPGEFLRVREDVVAMDCNLSITQTAELLRDVFSHAGSANRGLTFPPRDSDVDAAFRPLLALGGGFCMQPAPMAAKAIVNAAVDWCRAQWKKNKNNRFDDDAIGPLFEQFVRERLAEHGVTVLHGEYKEGQTTGECDAVVETNESVIFFELKSKMLRREGRSGDDVVAMADLASAIVRPQAQAMERHAVLHAHGVMTLTNPSSVTKIELRGREVLKVSVTRGDLGSLHDRLFLQRLLRAGCAGSFRTYDSSKTKALNDLNTWFAKFKKAAQHAGELDLRAAIPFPRSWSLSIFQLLLLLERTTDNASFVRELQRTRYVQTPLRDFYAEYEYLLSLKSGD